MGPRIRELAPADRNDVADALVRCGAFTAEEIAVALELFDAGSSAGYWLFGAEVNGRIAGYVCIGTATLTESSWYVYWLCVHPDAQRRGIARALQDRAEHLPGAGVRAPEDAAVRVVLRASRAHVVLAALLGAEHAAGTAERGVPGVDGAVADGVRRVVRHVVGCVVGRVGLVRVALIGNALRLRRQVV